MPRDQAEGIVATEPYTLDGFAWMLGRLRREAGLTQEELAERSGLSVRGIGRLEHGGRRPRPVTVLRLAEALGLDDAGRESLRIAAERMRSPSTATDRPRQRTPVEECADEVERLHQDGRHIEVLVACGHLIGLADVTGDLSGAAAGHLWRGMSARALGNVDASLPDLHTAVTLAEFAGDDRLLALGLAGVALIAHFGGEVSRSHRYFQRIRDLATAQDDRDLGARMETNLSIAPFMSGDWGTALRHLERAIELGRGERAEMWARHIRAEILIAAGRLGQARQELETALASGVPDIDLTRRLTGSLAELDVEQGRPDVALRRLVPMLDQADHPEWHVTEMMPHLAQAYLAIGDLGQARCTAEAAVARARQARQTHGVVAALQVVALVRARAGDRGGASATLDEALGLASEMGAMVVPRLAVRQTSARAARFLGRTDEAARIQLSVDRMRTELSWEIRAAYS